MNIATIVRSSLIPIATAFALALVTACARDYDSYVSLDGSQEAPAVTTKAYGKGKFEIESDKDISGKIRVYDMNATAAHLHLAPTGQSGPVIIPLEKTSDNTFAIPKNTKLDDKQYAAYQKGDLYVNVHSLTYPGGEIRAQILPEEPSK